METMPLEAFRRIVSFQGIKHALVEPDVLPVSAVPTAEPVQVPRFTAVGPTPGLPTVAVFDSGIAPDATALAPWVVSRDAYIVPPDTNFEHGTAVSSLIVDGRGLNSGHPQFPVTPCLIHDV